MDLYRILKQAYNFGRDNGSGRSEKNLNDFIEKPEIKQLLIHSVSGSFLDELIGKHKANKKLALENCTKMKDSDQYPWYDASFNNELLFVFDLEDLKCRSGL